MTCGCYGDMELIPRRYLTRPPPDHSFAISNLSELLQNIAIRFLSETQLVTHECFRIFSVFLRQAVMTIQLYMLLWECE